MGKECKEMPLFPVCPVLTDTKISSFSKTGGRYDNEKSLILWMFAYVPCCT